MDPREGCPLCQANASMLEHLSKGRIFCGCCGQTYALDEAGKVVERQATNHAPKRKTDVNGYPIDE